MRCVNKLFYGILFVLLIPILVSGVEYYVDASGGNDSNDGLSPETAWQTYGKTASFNFQTGDDVFFKRGETFTHTVYFHVRHSGTPNDPVIIGAYGEGPRPIITTPYGGFACYTPNLAHITIQDLDIRNATSGQSVALNADNTSHVTIRRLNIDGNLNRNGILLTKIDNYLIENCTISNIGNSGIAIIGTDIYPITNGIIRNNVIYNVRSNDGITLHKNGDGDDIGPNHLLVNNLGYNCSEQAYDLTSGHNITLINNEGYGNGICGISIGHNPSNIWIDRQYIYDELNVGICAGYADNVKITNSIIYNSGYHQLTIGDSSGAGRSATNYEVYNNIIIYGPNSTGSLLDISSGAYNVTYRNNIITTTHHSTPRNYLRFLSGNTPNNTNSRFSHNIWWRPDGGLEADSRHWYFDGEGEILVGFDEWNRRFPDDQYVDPQIVDPLNRDFHLQPTSPGIDGGVDVGLIYDHAGSPRLQGNAPDIGAFESSFSACDVLGDVDRDCDVDLDDLIMVVNDFGRRSGFFHRADTDSSQVIDIFDIVFVASRFT